MYIKQREAFSGMSTPWGKADHVSAIIPGVWTVSTPSHGGIRLAADRNARVPDYMRAAAFNGNGAAGWYEEDCDWCIPFVVFEAEILAAGDPYAVKAIQSGQHKETLRNWLPACYEQFFGEIIPAGQSYRKDNPRDPAFASGGAA